VDQGCPGAPHRLGAAVEIEELQRAKLAAELHELRYAAKRSNWSLFVSALTPLVVGALALYAGVTAQRLGDRQHDADIYARLVQDLGSPNPAARAGAIVGLADFAKSGQPHASQTTTMLVTQLETESDSRVLRVLVPAVASIGTPTLAQVVRENRTASLHFRRAAHAYVKLLMPSVDVLRPYPLRSRIAIIQLATYRSYSTLDDSLQDALDTNLMTGGEQTALEATALRLRFVTALNPNRSQAENDLSRFLRFIAAGNDETYGYIDSLFDVSPVASGGRERAVAIARARADATRSGRSLFVSSLVIERLVLAKGTPLAEADWQGVVLPAIYLDGLSLRDAKLNNSFLGGSARDADFSGADLSGATLSLDLHRANLSYATLDDAEVSDFADAYVRSANYTGANWWNSKVKTPEPFAVGIEPDGARCAYYQPIPGLAKMERQSLKARPPSSARFFIALAVPDYEANRRHDARVLFEKLFPRQANERMRTARNTARQAAAASDDSFTFDIATPNCTNGSVLR
jgi:Pentapeptide repeats (8 copies)